MAERIGINIDVLLKAAQATAGLKKFNAESKKSVKTENDRQKAEVKASKLRKRRQNELARMAGAIRRTADATRTMSAATVLQNATMVAGSIAIGAVAAVLILLTAVVAGTLKAYADFERAVVRANAVLRANSVVSSQVMSMTSRLGRTTLATFQEVAGSVEQLARAGLNASISMAALPSVIELSIAANASMSESTEIVIRTLFGFGIAIEDLRKTLDSFALVSISANVTLQQLGQSMKFVAPVARVAGIAFEEVIAALGQLGNAGIQASLAGTTLRAAIARLVNPSREASLIIRKFGLNTLVTNGKISSMADVIEMLRKGGATTADVFSIFGLRAGPGMAALLAIGETALRKLTREAEQASGVLAELASRNMATLSAQSSILWKQFKAATIAAGEFIAASTGLQGGMTNANETLEGFNKSMEAVNATKRESAEIDRLTIRMTEGVVTSMKEYFVNALKLKNILPSAGPRGAFFTATPEQQEGLKNIKEQVVGLTAAFKAAGGAAAGNSDQYLKALQVLEEQRRALMSGEDMSFSIDTERSERLGKYAIELERVNSRLWAQVSPMIAADVALDKARATQEAYIAEFEFLQGPNSPPESTMLLVQASQRYQKEAGKLARTLGFELKPEFVALAETARQFVDAGKEIGDIAVLKILRPFKELPTPELHEFVEELKELQDVAQHLADNPPGEFVPTTAQLGDPAALADARRQSDLARGIPALLGGPDPSGGAALASAAKSFADVQQVISDTDSLLKTGASSWGDYTAALAENAFQMQLVKEAMVGATDEQRTMLVTQQEGLEGQEEQLKSLQRSQVGLRVLGTTMDAVNDAMLQWLRTGKLSAKGVARAIRDSIFQQMATQAIKEVVLGLGQLALAAAPGTPTPAHLASASLHFKAAAVAGTIAGGALLAGAGGPSGGGATTTESAASSGFDAAQVPQARQLPNITVVFENGSTVIAQSQEEFGRDIAEQVIKALDDNVR